MTMQRSYPSTYSNLTCCDQLIEQMAFHEAGHAVSIYLGNQQKKLPAIFFQIKLQSSDSAYFARIIGGQLIQIPSVMGLINNQPVDRLAFDADIINLLAGSLAEAQYTSIRDNEVLNNHLLNLEALNYYGGTMDIKKAYYYLECFLPSLEQQTTHLKKLLQQSYQFISDKDNWRSITRLAKYILEKRHQKNIIGCEEIIAVINQ